MTQDAAAQKQSCLESFTDFDSLQSALSKLCKASKGKSVELTFLPAKFIESDPLRQRGYVGFIGA